MNGRRIVGALLAAVLTGAVPLASGGQSDEVSDLKKAISLEQQALKVPGPDKKAQKLKRDQLLKQSAGILESVLRRLKAPTGTRGAMARAEVDAALRNDNIARGSSAPAKVKVVVNGALEQKRWAVQWLGKPFDLGCELTGMQLPENATEVVVRCSQPVTRVGFSFSDAEVNTRVNWEIFGKGDERTGSCEQAKMQQGVYVCPLARPLGPGSTFSSSVTPKLPTGSMIDLAALGSVGSQEVMLTAP